MMEYNRELLALCNNNPQIYANLWSEWPQINPKTKLVRADGYTVCIAHLAKSKCEYTKNTWYDKSGLRARVWRALGELIGRRSVYRKGQYLDYPHDVPQAETEILELRRFGYRDQRDDLALACAYHPTSDTLYFREMRG